MRRDTLHYRQPMTARDFRLRMLAIADQLRAQGVSRNTTAPPIYRLAWTLGIRLRPPFYQSFLALAIGFGVWFAVVWGTVSWFLLWRPLGRSITVAAACSVVAGCIFGLLMALYYRGRAAELQLPALDIEGG